ncbi:glycosyltransferase [Actinomycetospora termitidis]|uniref:Glycosyltransferase n=1 Tax=Actinomycetospora termitidis TaxID=3053470 RepID=A0ABT7M2S2_9PSEU|nr:glycosyltransferase [Actinomycetospora sp. Odt1-22]MDL5154332.1 glycosyltransferase [Actinomycetospora sp. Odt1-22]
MRILVAALGSPGHAFPLVPLARALHDAGHDVTFATGPDLEPTVATSGVPTLAVGRPVFEVFRETMLALGMTGPPTSIQGTREVAGRVFGAAMPREIAPALRAWLADHPADLVIAETGSPGASLAAGATGTPCVLHSFGRRPVPVAPFAVRVREPLARVAAEVGIDVTPGDRLAHAYLDVCPPSLQSPGTADVLAGLAELPLRPVGWNPPTPVERHRRPGNPWVLLTLGTAFGQAGVLRAAVEGLAAPDRDVLVATGSVDAGELADLRADGVQVESFVPQADLLASDDPPAVVVHHGGSGTTLSCAGTGVPQLLLPQGADQFFNADAVTRIGAGRQLVGPEATPAAVGKAVVELLDPAAPERACARALASEVAALPGPVDVAARVEAWAQPAM